MVLIFFNKYFIWNILCNCYIILYFWVK